MTAWGSLAGAPEAGWEFPAEESRRRVEGARRRMAGLGLDALFLTGEKNILEAGMALTLEPSLVLPATGGRGRRLMVHEENIVVTRDGYELLTRRAPAELPVIA